jgi:hypothetical protein
MIDRETMINEPGIIGSRSHRFAVFQKIDMAHAFGDARQMSVPSAMSIFLVPKIGWLMAVAPNSLALASSLFSEISSLCSTPTDGVYVDCLISTAFCRLRAALSDDVGEQRDALLLCATTMETCKWLPMTLRQHVAQALRATAEGALHPRLALDIIASAADRTQHQMVIDCVRSAGSDGLSDLAEALLSEKAARH